MPQQDRFVWMTPLDSCKNNGWDGETELSSHAPARPQTARLKHVRHIETPRSAKHEANNRLYKIWPLRQKIAVAIWPSAAERYILRYFKRNLRHLLTWLYIEESTLKHRVPAQPLHPACSNCHPAISVASSHLQRLGNAKGLASWMYMSIWNAGVSSSASFLMASQNPMQWGDTFNEHHTSFFTTNSSDKDVVWPHSQYPPNHKLTAHVADKETLLVKLSWHFPIESRRNREASTFFKSSMSCSSWIFREHARPFSCQKLNKH